MNRKNNFLINSVERIMGDVRAQIVQAEDQAELYIGRNTNISQYKAQSIRLPITGVTQVFWKDIGMASL